MIYLETLAAKLIPVKVNYTVNLVQVIKHKTPENQFINETTL